jgi:hypothetical protein
LVLELQLTALVAVVLGIDGKAGVVVHGNEYRVRLF